MDTIRAAYQYKINKAQFKISQTPPWIWTLIRTISRLPRQAKWNLRIFLYKNQKQIGPKNKNLLFRQIQLRGTLKIYKKIKTKKLKEPIQKISSLCHQRQMISILNKRRSDPQLQTHQHELLRRWDRNWQHGMGWPRQLNKNIFHNQKHKRNTPKNLRGSVNLDLKKMTS